MQNNDNEMTVMTNKDYDEMINDIDSLARSVRLLRKRCRDADIEDDITDDDIAEFNEWEGVIEVGH